MEIFRNIFITSVVSIALGIVIGGRISVEKHFKELKEEIKSLKLNQIDIPLEHSLSV